jgi:hypothetical protein
VGDDLLEFFWSAMSCTLQCPFEESALQAVCFLQRLYGFVIVTSTTRECELIGTSPILRMVLAVSVLRLGGVVSPISAGGCVDTLSESVWCQLICN